MTYLRILFERNEDPYYDTCCTCKFADPLYIFSVTQGFVADRPMCL